LAIGSGTATVCARFRIAADGPAVVSIDAAHGGWLIYITLNNLLFYEVSTGNTGIVLEGGIVTGVEYFMVAMLGANGGSPKSVKLALFSGLVAALNGPFYGNGSIALNNAGAFELGDDTTSDPTNGNVWEVVWFNRALTAAEAVLLNLATGARRVDVVCSLAPTAYWPLNGDSLDYSDGAGAGAYPLTNVGAVPFASEPADWTLPAFGSAIVTYSAIFSNGQVVVTYSRGVVNSIDLTNPANYTITPPGGMPAVVVTGVTVLNATQVALAISGDVRRGGTYALLIAANTARAENDGGGNSAGSVNFTVTAVPFLLEKGEPQAPYPSNRLLITFTKPAKQVSSGGTHDALNPANYAVTSLVDGSSVAVSSVARGATSDTVLLILAANLAAGIIPYKVLANANLQDVDGNGIS
jgi:hypothetical protein